MTERIRAWTSAPQSERAEAVCHLAEDDAGAQRALGRVVGRRHGAVGQEGEELAAPALGLPLQLGPRRGHSRQGQQAVEPTVGLGAVVGQGAVLQRRPPPADGDGPAEQAPQRRGEPRLTGLHRVLNVAQDMGEAELLGAGVALLRAPAVGDPAAGPAGGRPAPR